MDKFSFLGALHTGLIEEMYDKYLQDPQSIEEEWRNFFQGFDFAKEVYTEEDIPQVFQKEFKVINLIDAYSMGLDFTDKKDDAELILLGSRKIEITDVPKVKGIFRAGAGKENVPEKHCTENNIKIMYPSPNTMNELFD